MGAAAGLWSAGCLPQKPAYSSLSLETSPNLQASGGGGAGGESQQEGKEGGVTLWEAVGPGDRPTDNTGA